jgi:hypothetical protein
MPTVSNAPVILAQSVLFRVLIYSFASLIVRWVRFLLVCLVYMCCTCFELLTSLKYPKMTKSWESFLYLNLPTTKTFGFDANLFATLVFLNCQLILFYFRLYGTYHVQRRLRGHLQTDLGWFHALRYFHAQQSSIDSRGTCFDATSKLLLYIFRHNVSF